MNNTIKNYTRLRAEERDLIAIYLHEGKSLREIAKMLNRATSTISQEVKRNTQGMARYSPTAAHRYAINRRHKPLKLLLERKPQLLMQVLKLLRRCWSPERIAMRLGNISAETIYSFIYRPRNRKLRLWRHLPMRYRKRRKLSGRGTKRDWIAPKQGLSARPRSADNRWHLGHLEADMMVSGKDGTGGVAVMVDRKTRMLMTRKVPDFKASSTLQAQLAMLDCLPEHAKRSITMDNGYENHYHYKLPVDTYFCDPHSPWQKGTVERLIRDLRIFFPKRTDFAKVPQELLDEVTHEINKWPKICLQGRSSYQEYHRLIKRRRSDSF